MAGLPHLQGRFGARQHGHLPKSRRISDQDLCPPAWNIYQKYWCHPPLFLPMSLSSPYFLKQTWRPIRMNRLGSHHLPVTSPYVPAVNHLFCSFLKFCLGFYASCVMLVIACLCCMSYELCLLIVIILVVWSVLENQINWQHIYSFVTSIAASVLQDWTHIKKDCLSIFSLAKKCNSQTYNMYGYIL